MSQKNRDLDILVGGRLDLFMKAKGLTDASFGKQIGAAAPTVATWRHGTRPYPHWHEALGKATGWDWSNPESIAAGLSSDEAAKIRANATAPRVRRSAQDKAAPAPADALTFGSFAGLTLARDGVANALSSGRPLDPSVPADALVLNLCAEALNIEVARRTEKDADFRSADELRTLVLGHRDPIAFLAFLRSHVDAKLLRLVETSLPTASTTAPAAAAVA